MGAAVATQALTTVGGSIITARAQRAQGEARQGYFEFLAQQAEGQSRLALIRGAQQSRAIQDAAARDFSRFKRNIKRTKGAQTAAIAAAGISGSATAEDIARDTAEVERLDELAIRFNADSQSDEVLQTAKLRSVEFQSQALQNRFAGSEARRVGRARGTQTLLSGATTTAVSVSTAAFANISTSPSTGLGPRRRGGESFSIFRRRRATSGSTLINRRGSSLNLAAPLGEFRLR